MTIILTKVRPPQRRKDILRRVRLVDSLHQNLHRKLTFVSAPAGYGKTTLLVDFANDVDAMVFWYRIGAEDNDLVQFVQHLIASFQQRVPKFGKALEERLNNIGSAPDAPSLAVDFINEVEQRVEDFSLLILDDYHLAGENQQIVDFLENLLEHLPDRLRILIGSRSVYGIPAASLYVRDELVTISADELRFRADELQKLVLQNYRMRLSDEQADEFAKRADGWIVAILLALRTMENGVLPKLKGGITKIYEYLAEEVVNRQSPELREFMLATSILNDFNEELCNYLLERKDSAQWLRSLEDRNLFVSRTETREGASYRYHQLFSEFLQDYFVRNRPERMRELHRRAAGWHKKRGEWEAAISHKLAAGDKREAAEWMDAVAGRFYASDRLALLNRWLEQLTKPPDCRKFAPALLLYQAKALGNQGHINACLKLLDLAEPILKRSSDPELSANAMVTKGMALRVLGNYGKAKDYAKQAHDLLAGKPRRVKKSRQWYQADRLEGIASYYLKKIPDAIQHLETAANGLRDLVNASEGGQRNVFSYDLAECLNDLGLIYISIGDILNSQKAFQDCLAIHKAIHSNLGALASARNNVAYLQHQVGHFAEAWKEYASALENARAANRVREQIAVFNGRGELLLDIDEVGEAQINFQAALDLEKQFGERPELAATYLGMARAHNALGEHQEAMNWLRKAASFPGNPISDATYQVELGSIYADMGQNALALKEFKSILANPDGRPNQTEVLAAFLAARSLYRTGKSDRAFILLNEALEAAAELGYDQFLVIAARRSSDLLGVATAGTPNAQLRSFLERVRTFQSGLAAIEATTAQETPPLLRMEVQAFGKGEIRINGERLLPSDWKSGRARGLFLYLLDKGKANKEAIGMDFWPEFSAAKTNSNFHATLWRVRQAIGFKDAIRFNGVEYSLNPSLQIWYDVAEFERFIHLANDPAVPETNQSEYLRQAANLYREPYLLDSYFEWADRRRGELRNTYLTALSKLAKIETDNKRFGEARKLYEQIVAADPYRDEAHLSLMKCLALSGAPSAAIAHYKSYKSALRKELNSEPLPELQKYYESLNVKA